ncbi:MAG TPA: nucleotide exchange factor GrpE [Gemmatimonadales bacterium]|nr:nucleotide exchange factor GrpE [Gemmatimonadales bacterium]
MTDVSEFSERTPPPAETDAEAQAAPATTSEGAGPTEPEAATLPVEPPEQAAKRLQAELDELKDRHLRLAAEFDNYKKRMVRERIELADRAQADLLRRLLDPLDDMDRVLAGDPATVSAAALHEGIALLEKKLWKELEAAGLEHIDPRDQPFDPGLHEAVSMVPAPSPDRAGTVAATFQPGYRFKGLLIRPARVQVYSEQGLD